MLRVTRWCRRLEGRYRVNDVTYPTRWTRLFTKRSVSPPPCHATSSRVESIWNLLVDCVSSNLSGPRTLERSNSDRTVSLLGSARQIQAVTEKPPTDIYDPLRHLPPGKKSDFSSLRSNIYEERIKPLREAVNRAKSGNNNPSGNPDQARGKGMGMGMEGDGEREERKGVKKQRQMQQNIIVLSSSPTALVTMWNVKKLLEEGV